MEFSFVTYGIKQLAAKMNRFANEVKDFRPLFNDIAENFYKLEELQFRGEGSRSEKWKPLNPKYAEQKGKRFPGGTILIRSGDLAASLMTGNAPGSIRMISEKEMRLGTENKIGIFHFKGTRTMPSRRPINLTDADKSTWAKKHHQFVVLAMRDKAKLGAGGSPVKD